MSQPEFMFKPYGRGHKPRLVEAYTASYREETRTTKVIAGLGRMVEGTGKFDKRIIGLFAGGTGRQVYADKVSIHKHLRRLRPQEAERLDAIDAEIARLRAEREELIATAWTKAHVIALGEVTAKADAALKRKKATQ